MNINYPMIQSYNLLGRSEISRRSQVAAQVVMYRARYGVNLLNPLGILGLGLYSYFQSTKSGSSGGGGGPGSANDDLLEKRGRCYDQLSAYGKCLEVTGYCYLACERELDAYKQCLQNHPTKE